jgi:hypothetical protein
MSEQDIIIAKATSALEESVRSILECDDSDAIKRVALAETATQFQDYLERNVGAADIAKAARAREHRGPHSLTGALLRHLHEQLDRERERYGYRKSATKEQPMDSIHSIMKSTSVTAACEAIIAKGSTSISQDELVEAATKIAHARFPHLDPVRAFARVYEDQGAEGLALRKAINVAKASAFQVFYGAAMQPTQTVGDTSAYAELMAKAAEYRKAHPELTEAQAFAKIYEDPANLKIAKRERVESAVR